MTLILEKGSYLPDGKGGFLRAQGAQGLLAEALFRLSCRRGAFPLLPNLGSRLHTLTREKPSAWEMAARQHCAEALNGLPLTLKQVTVTATGGNTLCVTVYLQIQGETLLAEVNV